MRPSTAHSALGVMTSLVHPAPARPSSGRARVSSARTTVVPTAITGRRRRVHEPRRGRSGTSNSSGNGGSWRSGEDTPECRVSGATSTPFATRRLISRAVKGRPALGISGCPGCAHTRSGSGQRERVQRSRSGSVRRGARGRPQWRWLPRTVPAAGACRRIRGHELKLGGARAQGDPLADPSAPRAARRRGCAAPPARSRRGRRTGGEVDPAGRGRCASPRPPRPAWPRR